MSQDFEIKAKEICIFDDKRITLETLLPAEASEQERLNTQLEALGFKNENTHMSYPQLSTKIFSKNQFPIDQTITIQCNNGCITSYNDPSKNIIENRIQLSPYCTSTDSYFNCAISEKNIVCRTPLPLEAKAKREFKVSMTEDRITDEFDGLVYMAETVKFDEDDEIDHYGLNVDFYPRGDEEKPYKFLEQQRPREEMLIDKVRKTRQFLGNIFEERDFDLIQKKLHNTFQT